MHGFLRFVLALSVAVPVHAVSAAYAADVAPGLTVVDDYTIVAEKSFLDYAEPVNPDGTINVIVEIPAGTVAKWEVTKPDGKLAWEFKQGKPREVAYLGYPGNYGMLPRTLLSEESGGDGDPLDAIVLGDAIARGAVVRAKVIGLLKLRDGGEKDDKVLAVLDGSPLAEVDTPEEMERAFPGVLAIVRTWFESYKGPGELTSDGYAGPEETLRLIRAARAAFE